MSELIAEQAQIRRVDELRDRLVAQARLFDDPESYRAGVEDAIHAVLVLDLSDRDVPLSPTGGWFG